MAEPNTNEQTPPYPTLTTIMNIDLIRDEVMYWLKPIDALNLELTCKGMISNEGVRAYTSPFRYVFKDRYWLMGKMREGYKFTLVSPYLSTMMKGVDGANARATTKELRLMDRKSNNRPWLELIAVWHNYNVPCTREFMPTDVLATIGIHEDERASIITNDAHIGSTGRWVYLDAGGVVIELRTRVSGFPYRDEFIPIWTDDDEKVYDDNGFRTIEYVIATENRNTIRNAIGDADPPNGFGYARRLPGRVQPLNRVMESSVYFNLFEIATSS